jgi:formate dehydrogenase
MQAILPMLAKARFWYYSDNNYEAIRMSEVKVVSQDQLKKRQGKPKGRIVGPAAHAEIVALLGKASRAKDLLIEHLHKIQDKFGHISAAHLAALAHEMKLSQTEAYEVATFYHHFDVIKEGETPPPALTVRVCDSVTCAMFGAQTLIKDLKASLGDGIRVQPVPCVGRCQHAPVAVVGQNPVDNASVQTVQARVATKAIAAPLTDYISYEQYLTNGGYQLYRECVAGKRSAEELIKIMETSGLRGLGGAGFRVGSKWRIVAGYAAPRYMAMNIDEGEPGTFKDRYYLELDPHRFIEGMLIATWAVGIDKIWVYLRDEYAGCRKILETELAKLEANPPAAMPEIELRRGAGAYICGEESAMVESIEGKRGMPRLRPPYLAEVGLFGRPTLEHNMESVFWVRDIVEKGAEWFTAHGRHERKGLRSFSVSGRVKKPGVHLAPAGITMRELIAEYCGGMLDGHEFYGYFPGGASGGILPASLGDVPLDFDTLNQYGCFIGSAAVIVFSQHDRARDLALNSLKFFEDESCGQCTPCRAGTAKAVKLMEKSTWDQPLLNELSGAMIDASICGLGQAAPNPISCVIKYFPQELLK